MANVVEVLSYEIPVRRAGLARVLVSRSLFHTAKPAHTRRDRLGEEGSARLEFRGRARPLDRHAGEAARRECSSVAVFFGMDWPDGVSGVRRGTEILRS